MKTSILTLSFLVASSLLGTELSWVDEQVQAIKPARSGMSNRSVVNIKDPFIFLAKNRGKEDEKVKVAAKEASKPSVSVASTNSQALAAPKKVKGVNTMFTLGMIMNNSVMINSQWYRLGDKVNGYKITELNHTSVLLTKKKKQLLLSTKSSSKNLKFQR